MENIQIDGLSIKKALRYVLQSKRKNSVERAFNFLQTAYLKMTVIQSQLYPFTIQYKETKYIHDQEPAANS